MEGFLNPAKILNQLELRADMTAVDFGCGSGGWVIPLAKRLEEGKVYAIDILEEPLSALEGKAKAEKILNIETVIADIEEGTKLLPECCDLVLMTNLLFEVDDKKGAVKEAKRVLKKEGEILIVDWKTDAPLGPEKSRVSADEVKGIAKDSDLKLEKEFEAGNYHYGLVFRK